MNKTPNSKPVFTLITLALGLVAFNALADNSRSSVWTCTGGGKGFESLSIPLNVPKGSYTPVGTAKITISDSSGKKQILPYKVRENPSQGEIDILEQAYPRNEDFVLKIKFVGSGKPSSAELKIEVPQSSKVSPGESLKFDVTCTEK